MSAQAKVEEESGFDIQTKLLGGAVVGLGVGLIGLLYGLSSNDKTPFLGWLWGSSFWLSIAIGMLMLVMIFRVFNSRWNPIVAPTGTWSCSLPMAWALPASTSSSWLVGRRQSGILWTWINPEANTIEAMSITRFPKMFASKESRIFELGFFTIRLISYFGIFCGLSYWLRKFLSPRISMETRNGPIWE